MLSSVGSSDLDYLMQSYRTLEEQPIRRLETQRDTVDNRRSLFGDLKSKLRSLESLAKELSYSSATSVFGQKTATVSDESYLTLTANSSATVTSHSIEVSQLARADKIISNQLGMADTSLFTSLGAGTFQFDITVDGASQPISVDIADGDDNETILNKIVTAVNGTSDLKVRASVIHDTEDTGRLVFTAEETGADFEMTLADGTGSLLSTLGMNDSVAMNGTSGGYVYDSSELNAVLVVDGITIERNSNTIENAISGLTINLLKPHETGDAPVTANVDNDVEGIKSKIKEFMDAYNEVMDFIETNTSVNSATYERSALSGDFAVNNLKLQLRSLLSQPVTGVTAGDPTILAQIGITAGRNGKLSISDSDTLDEFLEGDLDKVATLFNSDDGIANRFVDSLDANTSGDGIIEKRRDALQGQINLINGRIDRLEVSVDRRMDYYRQQFSQLQSAMNMYSSQSYYLGNIQQTGYLY